MLKPRTTVPKTFRIDGNLAQYLSELSDITGRSQNDLINIAVEKLLFDNRGHFDEDLKQVSIKIVGDLISYENKNEYTSESIKLKKTIGGTGKITIDYTTPEENGKESDSSALNLRMKMIVLASQWGKYVDVNSEEVKQYFREKFDFR